MPVRRVRPDGWRGPLRVFHGPLPDLVHGRGAPDQACRYGRSLVDAGKPADALPYLSQAADKAYGANRLAVALQRVKALKALHRNDEAKKLADDVLETNGPWFPKQADALKAELKA